jgi:hypothetical protein
MSNVGTSGKFGTSMDTSQLTELRRKYRTIQMQNSKSKPGDQSVKPIFNSNKVIGGDSQNGSSTYYNEKGLALMYKRPGLTRIS